MRRLLQIILPIIVLALAWVSYRHFSTPPKKPDSAHTNQSQQPKHRRGKSIRTRPARQTVSVSRLRAQDYTVLLYSQGVVKPKNTTTLTPNVSGKITYLSPTFEVGGYFQKNDILAEIETANYETEIITAQSSLARAKSALAQEQARAAQALRNWQDIGFKEKPNNLVLRKPQLAEAQANVAAQEALLEKARRNLAETKIRAPFAGRVLTRDTSIGQNVGTGSNIGAIYPTASAQVSLALSAKQLTQLSLSKTGKNNIPVTLTNALLDDPEHRWQATIRHIDGQLNATTRELVAIAEINDPFGLQSDQAPLLLNQPVNASIQGNTLKNVFLIPAELLYDTDWVITLEDNKVKRTQINILWRTADSVVTDTPLEGKTFPTQRVNIPTNGTPLLIAEDSAKAAQQNPSEKTDSEQTAGSQDAPK